MFINYLTLYTKITFCPQCTARQAKVNDLNTIDELFAIHRASQSKSLYPLFNIDFHIAKIQKKAELTKKINSTLIFFNLQKLG